MRFPRSSESGRFRVTDAIAITAVLLLIGGCLFLDSLSHEGRRPMRIQCLIQLKQIAVAYQLWATDHGEEKYPMEVPVDRGGIKGSPNEHNILTNFLILSKEINDPKILACPADKRRKPAESWSELTEKNISYFINIGATYGISGVTTQAEVLLGDRAITVNGQPIGGYFEPANASRFGWSDLVHAKGGDIALDDTSVHSTTDVQLNEFIDQSPPKSMRLLIP